MGPSPVAASGYARCQGWCSVDEESRFLRQIEKKKSRCRPDQKRKKIKYDFIIKQQNIKPGREYLLGVSADDKGKIYLKIESLAQ